MTGVIVPRERPRRVGHAPLSQRRVDRLQPGAHARTGNVERHEDGGHHKTGVRHGDDRPSSEPLGEALMGSTDPANEVYPTLAPGSERAARGGEQVERSILGPVLLPRQAISVTGMYF